MGIRETLNEKKGVSTALAIGLVAIAVGVIVWQVMATGQPSGPPQAFFTADDGLTYFAADASNIPPFDHEGKPAVRAHVYECNGKPFVAYIERYKAEARKVLVNRQQGKESAAAPAPELKPGDPGYVSPEGKARADYSTFQGPAMYGRELKKPGEKDWVSSGDFEKAAQLTNVKCADGSAPEPVEP